MSDNIPFDLQKEIIKKVSDVKSLIRLRSVSKPWKSFIDTSDFIIGYNARHTHPHSHILVYKPDYLSEEAKYIRLVDDDKNESLKVQQQEFAPFVVSPLLKQYNVSYVVGACDGLLCLCVYKPKCYARKMLIIWNPSIGKSFGIALPVACSQILPVYGFGVCPVTKDPTVVKIIHKNNKPWHVEVFTLSSGVWDVIPSSNLPRESIALNAATPVVVIDRFVYWSACEMASFTEEDDELRYNYMVVSFDLITKEFKVIDLPDSLTNELNGARVRVSNLRESLVVYGSIYVDGALCCGVWGMEHDLSFRKLLTIDTPVYNILGFTKSCEPIFATSKESGVSTIDVYDPCSQRIKNLGIYGLSGAFFMGSYKESLFLLNHSDSLI